MTYKLKFHEVALQEWRGLPEHHRQQLKSKLEERMKNPVVPASRLSGMPNCYKIKLKSPPLRLIYEVDAEAKELLVYAVGKRDGRIYTRAQKRQVVVRKARKKM